MRQEIRVRSGRDDKFVGVNCGFSSRQTALLRSGKKRKHFPERSVELQVPSAALGMNNRTLDRVKALEGLRPSFSAHVRWCEHGAHVQCAVARTVHCSLNLPQASRLLLMNNRTLDRPKAFEGFARLFRPTYAGVNMGHTSSGGGRYCSLLPKLAAGKSAPRDDKSRVALRLSAVSGIERAAGCNRIKSHLS